MDDILIRIEKRAALHLKAAEALEREAGQQTAESRSLRWVAELNLASAAVIRSERRRLGQPIYQNEN
jgi:predicted ATPase